jgi:hypothetical protein
MFTKCVLLVGCRPGKRGGGIQILARRSPTVEPVRDLGWIYPGG